MVLINKKQKRQAIALSCMDLLIQENFKDLTIAKLANQAKIGKGTIYEYFLDKEDIILELTCTLYKDYKSKTLKKIKKNDSTKEKIRVFFTNLYEPQFFKHRKILNIFFGICHYNNNFNYKIFQKRLYKDTLEIFYKLIKAGIKNGMFKNESINLAKILLNSFAGFFVVYLFNTSCEKTKKDIDLFLSYFFKSIEIKS